MSPRFIGNLAGLVTSTDVHLLYIQNMEIIVKYELIHMNNIILSFNNFFQLYNQNPYESNISLVRINMCKSPHCHLSVKRVFFIHLCAHIYWNY